tara:strand:+ start:40040 stop:40363 length:324 start_codon:yes stop_codon:yes gene_type:complete
MLLALLGAFGVLGHYADHAGFARVGEGSFQVALQEVYRDRTFRDQEEKEGFIMGWGGALTLVNGSPFDWTVGSAPSYQMDAWSWPTVDAGEALIILRFSSTILILGR